MGVGARTDSDRVSIERKRVIKRPQSRHTQIGADRRSRLGRDVEHADHLGANDPSVQVLGMHRADAATAENHETDCHERALPSFPEMYNDGVADNSTAFGAPSATADAVAASTTACAA